MLTKTQLENHYHLAGEIGDIERQLADLEGKAKFTYGADTIMDYRSGYPIPQLIAGIGWSDTTHKRRQELIGRLSVKRGKLIQQKAKIEEELEEIQEADIRRIIRLRCFEHLSWNEIAAKMGESYSVECIKKKFQRFLKKI